MGVFKVYTMTVATAATQSNAVYLQHTYENVHLEIPSMTTGTDFYILGSIDGSAYRSVYEWHIHDAAGPAADIHFIDIYVPSTVTNCLLNTHAHFPYVKIRVSTATTDSSFSLRLLCSGLEHIKATYR